MISPTVVILSDHNLGDSICAMAAVQQLVAERPNVYVVPCNIDVFSMMKTNKMLDYRRMQESSMMHVAHLSITNSLADRGRYAHPIQQYLAQLHTYRDDVPQPIINLHPYFATTAYDFVIAPWSLDTSRCMQIDQWTMLINELQSLYTLCSILVIGSHDDPRPWPEHIGGLRYAYGAKLSQVAHYMQRAKRAVITIDSGPNRLAHAAEIKNQIILQPEQWPEYWVGNPCAICIPGNRKSWAVDQIVDAIMTLTVNA